MLQRVISIKNVGRFKNCAASGDVTFRPYTLVFAENARGKTTFCDILRSLSTGTPGIVIGRATLGSAGVPDIQFLMASGQINFRNGAWTRPYPDMTSPFSIVRTSGTMSLRAMPSIPSTVATCIGSSSALVA